MFWPPCSTMHGWRPSHAHWEFQQSYVQFSIRRKYLVLFLFHRAMFWCGWKFLFGLVWLLSNTISLAPRPGANDRCAIKDLQSDKMLVDAIFTLRLELQLSIVSTAEDNARQRGNKWASNWLNMNHITCAFHACHWLNVLFAYGKILTLSNEHPQPTCHDRWCWIKFVLFLSCISFSKPISRRFRL